MRILVVLIALGVNIFGIAAQAASWNGSQECGACSVGTSPAEYNLRENLNTDAGVFFFDDALNAVEILVSGPYDVCLTSLFKNTGSSVNSARVIAKVGGTSFLEGYASLPSGQFDTGSGCRTFDFVAGDLITFEHDKQSSSAVSLVGSNLNFHSFSIMTAN